MDKETFDRMVTEFGELNEKCGKLRDFLLDEKNLEGIDFLNRDLLVSQLKAMEAYLAILSIRLGLNAPKEETITDTEEHTECPPAE